MLAIATHVHADHIGSLHEFRARAGSRLTAGAFSAMPDDATFADEFRALPAPLTRLLHEGDVIDLGDSSV